MRPECGGGGGGGKGKLWCGVAGCDGPPSLHVALGALRAHCDYNIGY